MTFRSALGSALLSVCLFVGAARAQSVPSIDSVVNAANYKAGALGAAGWVSLTGSNLSPCTKVDGAQPTRLTCDTGEAVMVTANGSPLPLYYASPGQLNVLAPASPGTYDVVSSVNGLQSKPVTTTVARSNLGIFQNYHLAATINQNGAVHWYNNPARPGDIVSVYANAGGPTTSTEQVQAGPQTVTIEHTQPPTVTVEGQSVPVLFAGKAYGYKGLWQYNIKLPDSLPTGAHTMTFCLENACDSADLLVAQSGERTVATQPLSVTGQSQTFDINVLSPTAMTARTTAFGNVMLSLPDGASSLTVEFVDPLFYTFKTHLTATSPITQFMIPQYQDKNAHYSFDPNPASVDLTKDPAVSYFVTDPMSNLDLLDWLRYAALYDAKFMPADSATNWRNRIGLDWKTDAMTYGPKKIFLNRSQAPAAALPYLEQALHAWARNGTERFVEVDYDPTLVVGDAGVTCDYANYDNSNSAGLFVRDADLMVQGRISMSKSSVPGINYGNVFEHELGHILGLPHSPDTNSLMYWLMHNTTSFRMPEEIAQRFADVMQSRPVGFDPTQYHKP